jgi:hypothetical protein
LFSREYGIYADGFTDGLGKLAAMNCWWGNTSGPRGAGPGTGDAITSNVNYSPWAVEPVCSPLTDVDNADMAPSQFIVHPPYPNPFNPTTTIQFELPEAAGVRLAVYSIKGELVATLVEGALAAGIHKTIWDGKDHTGRKVASGLYFYHFNAGPIEQTGKLILLR